MNTDRVQSEDSRLRYTSYKTSSRRRIWVQHRGFHKMVLRQIKTVTLYYLLRFQRVLVHQDKPKGHSSLKASSLGCFLKYLSLHQRPLLFLHLKDTSVGDLIGLGRRVTFGLGRTPCTARAALLEQSKWGNKEGEWVNNCETLGNCTSTLVYKQQTYRTAAKDLADSIDITIHDRVRESYSTLVWPEA
jgi:hypothetical protein